MCRHPFVRARVAAVASVNLRPSTWTESASLNGSFLQMNDAILLVPSHCIPPAKDYLTLAFPDTTPSPPPNSSLCG